MYICMMQILSICYTQWGLDIADTIGTTMVVLYGEVSLMQR